jgi:hypothetical protein
MFSNMYSRSFSNGPSFYFTWYTLPLPILRMHQLSTAGLLPLVLFYCWLVLLAPLLPPGELAFKSSVCHFYSGTSPMVSMVYFHDYPTLFPSRSRSFRVKRALFPDLCYLYWSIPGPSLVVFLPKAPVLPTHTSKSQVHFSIFFDFQESSTSVSHQEQSFPSMLCSSITYLDCLSSSRMLGWYVGSQTH